MPFPGSCLLHVAQQMLHVMEGEDTCKSQDTVIRVSVKNAFMHTLTIHMPDFNHV